MGKVRWHYGRRGDDDAIGMALRETGRHTGGITGDGETSREALRETGATRRVIRYMSIITYSEPVSTK